MHPVSGASTSSSSSASAAAQRPVPSDKDEKPVAVPDPADEILAALEESASINEALAVAAGIMRRPIGDPVACKEAIAPLTTVAIELVKKDDSLQLLQTFLDFIQKNNPEFQGVELLPLLFTGNNKLVEQLLQQAVDSDVKKLPPEFQKVLMLPQVRDSISELDLKYCDFASLAAHFPNLQKLSILTGCNCRALTQLTRLEVLSIDRSEFDEEIEFQELKALTTLTCKQVVAAINARTGAPFPLLERLSRCPQLHTLTLGQCHNGPYPVMLQVRNLEMWGINGKGIDGRAIKDAFPALESLKVLYPEDVSQLQTIPSLRSLVVRHNSQEGSPGFGVTCQQQPQLTSLDHQLGVWAFGEADKWEKAFATFQSLRELTSLAIRLWLDISDPPLQPEQVAKMVADHPKLQSVTLRLGYEPVKASYTELFAALKSIPHVVIEHKDTYPVEEAVILRFREALPQCTFRTVPAEHVEDTVPAKEAQAAFLQLTDSKHAVDAMAAYIKTHSKAFEHNWDFTNYRRFKKLPLFLQQALGALR